MKQSLKKRPISKRGTTSNPDFIGDNPAAYAVNSGKSPGVPMVEMAPPNGTNNLTGGTNKNGMWVKRLSSLK